MIDDACGMTTSTLEPPSAGSDFAELSRRVAAAGLMRRRPGYYTFRFAAVGTGLVVTWLAFLALGDSPWQLLVAVAAAFGSGQLALLAHDVAHRQVFRGRRASAVAGRIMGNLGIGMSYGAWHDKHTRHHANPNHDGLDPDVGKGALAFTAEQASTTRSAPFRFVQRNQRALFFPLLTLAGVDLRVTSVRGLLTNDRIPARRLEAVLLALHAVAYLTVLFTVLPFWLAVGFVVVHQALFGVYLGSIFAPNHKGMEMPERKLDFLRKQVLTSRNVRGNRLTDRPLHVLMGGLNHQIEHHLFPSMPTANLRAARALVRGYCAEVGVPYYETGLVRSWREILDHLHEVGEPLRVEL